MSHGIFRGAGCVGVVALALVAGCGKKKSDTAKEVAESPLPDEMTSAVNALSEAYPGGLALSAFPQSVGARLTGEEEASKSVSEKVAEAEKILSGKADSCVPPALREALAALAQETCYEFDSDMVPTESQGSGQSAKSQGTLDGRNSAGEACLVAFARTQMASVVDQVDRSTGLVQAMLCQAKKVNPAVGLPKAADEELDLKAAMEAAFTGDAVLKGKMSITEAKIKRLADAGSRPVYKSIVKITDGQAGATREINMVHSPKAEGDNSEFNGTLWTRIVGSEMGGPGLPGGNDGMDRVMSIVYARVMEGAEPRMKYELRTARFKNSLDPFSSAGVVDLNTSASFTGTPGQPGYGDYAGAGQNANSVASGILSIVFDVNPSNNAGTMAYWQNPGGNYFERARGFVFNMEANDDGTLSGCATSGAAEDAQGGGLSIRRFHKETGLELKPRAYWHPFLQVQNLQGSRIEISTMPTEQRTCMPAAEGSGYYLECIQKHSDSDYQSIRWKKLAPSRSPLQGLYDGFVTQNSGGLVSRQCFRQNPATGAYELDTAQMDGETGAGFELLDVTNTADQSRVVAPPSIEEVKPFTIDVKSAK